MKNKTKLQSALIGGLLGMICAFITVIIINPNANPFRNKNTEELTEKNDYYLYVNKQAIDNKILYSDEKYWSPFATDTQNKIDNKIDNIVKEIIKNEKNYDTNSNEYKICQLYKSIVNPQNSLSKLNTYIDLIDNSTNINELVNNVHKVNTELSANLLIRTTLEHDLKDNKTAMISIAPFTFDYGTNYSDYYTNPLYSTYVGTYIEYDRKILELNGYSEAEAKQSIKKVSKLYAEIVQSSKTMEELSIISNRYDIISREELENIFSNIDINLFLGEYKDYKINIIDKKQAKKINELLVDDNIETIKEYLKLQLLQNYGIYADTKYYNLINELSAKMNGTGITTDTREDYAIDIVSHFFDDTITKEYVKQYGNEESINKFNNIINDILQEYKLKINSNEWLSEQTKKKAILKLENMSVNIGYPEQFEDYSKNYQLNDILFDNIISMNKEMTKSHNEVIINNEKYWLLSPLTVNAYYNSQDNSINFPIALLEYEGYNENNSYYQNLGSLGMVIAHEITHAFDNNGALFDENGNMNNWWTEQDYKEFEKLQEKVINYYNDYKINGKSVNGKLTVSENIADLGAVSCIVDIANRRNANIDEKKTLFESFGKIWSSKSTEEYAKLLMISDTHSPDKIRVNAVLSSIDEFYKVYNIKKGDGMFKDEKDRIKVW